MYKLIQCCALDFPPKMRSLTVPRFGFFQDSRIRVKRWNLLWFFWNLPQNYKWIPVQVQQHFAHSKLFQKLLAFRERQCLGYYIVKQTKGYQKLTHLHRKLIPAIHLGSGIHGPPGLNPSKTFDFLSRSDQQVVNRLGLIRVSLPMSRFLFNLTIFVLNFSLGNPFMLFQSAKRSRSGNKLIKMFKTE